MFRTRLYYQLKPLLPPSARMAVRRWFAVRIREQSLDKWPILPGSEKPPANWPGWPDGKQFAFVLTHDIEGPEGLAKVRKLAELEMELGFRSSFNFIPEGDYTVPSTLRTWLADHGFEVGVHDLYHDGKLFSSRDVFERRAPKINRHLKEWGAVGFRSGFMFHNLEWLHDLDVAYDASTFDTDPFEPQPDGVNTIFPFWVAKPNSESRKQKAEMAPNAGLGSQKSDPTSAVRPPSSVLGAPSSVLRPPSSGSALESSPSQHFSVSAFQHLPEPPPSDSTTPPLHHSTTPLSSGYVELPYTLPQDSTLFLLLRERHPDIWFQKLDWIAKHAGMALVNVHPDYVRFDGESVSPRTFSFKLYASFLEYVRSRHSGAYWHGLPKEVARLVRNSHSPPKAGPAASSHLAPRSTKKPKIWIDLDNTPHVPFFEPILDELRCRGFPLLVTARDAFQVCDLADKKRLECIKIGRHHGKHRLLKALGLAYRSLQLMPLALREKPALAVSHGARSQLLLSFWLRIPRILIEDYEYSQFLPMMRPTWVIAPEVIPDKLLCSGNGQIRKYKGIKEDAYAWKLKPDASVRTGLGISESELVVIVRPPATEAHYHNPEAEALFECFMERACQTAGARIVLLPRNKKQGDLIRQRWPKWFENRKTVIPREALDGLNLIWHSDLVVSGGGTMNREAAALGVPVYSIFRGMMGAVDRNLNAQGRLVFVESKADVDRKIHLVKRERRTLGDVTSRQTLCQIVDIIQEIAESCTRRPLL